MDPAQDNNRVANWTAVTTNGPTPSPQWRYITATGTAAKTRVLITTSDGTRDWGTVGVSENIITASLQALVDSMEYALMRR